MIARLAEVLDRDPDELLRAAGYSSTGDGPREVDPPPQPRLTTLPLGGLPSDVFEELSTELLHRLLRGVADVRRHGAQGHAQNGIDGVIDYTAGERKGERWAFQCKRHKEFGPAAVHTAVREATFPADRYLLLLARTASTGARNAIDEHERWVLWDADDISRIIRTELSFDDQVRLIDCYMRASLEPFLGVEAPGPWLTREEFFRPIGGSTLYSHRWTLVGRTEERRALATFRTSQESLALVVGRGGVGKTRLLRAAAEDAEGDGWEVRFLERTGIAEAAHYEQLPDRGRLLVIIDDVHERSDLPALIGGILRARPTAHILLAMRPHGWAAANHGMRSLGLDIDGLPSVTLGDLALDQATDLADEVLGQGHPDALARRLAAVSLDCPLVTVVAAGLLGTGELDPDGLEGDRAIRDRVLASLIDHAVAAPVDGNPELRRSVLDAVAAFQPVRLNEPEFRDALEVLVGAPLDRIQRHLRDLEGAGILIRRGQTYRIAPDLLGDVVLAQAATDDRTGMDTGFLRRALGAARASAQEHLLINASRVDWQIRRSDPSLPSIADVLWDAVDASFYEADAWGRVHTLSLVRRVAPYQPERALALTRRVMAEPYRSEAVAHQGGVDRPSISSPDLRYELPTILRAVAYDLDHLKDALDLLWELAISDERPADRHQHHPRRVLADLATLEGGMPLRYVEVLVDSAERRLSQPATANMALDLLRPLLATEGHDTRITGATFSLTPFPVAAERVGDLRRRIIDLALRAARSDDLRCAVLAVQTIQDGLRYPIGILGRQVTAEEKAQWTPGFVETIECLGDLAVTPGLDPVVTVAVRRALRWHAEFSTTATRQAATDLLARIPTNLTHDLTAVLHDGWGHLTDEYEPADPRDRIRHKHARVASVARNLLKDRSVAEALDLFEERLQACTTAFGPSVPQPWPLAEELAHAAPSASEVVCQRVLEHPARPLTSVVPTALADLAAQTSPALIPTARALLELDNDEVSVGVARAFGWTRGNRTTILDGEVDLLRDLSRHVNVDVRVSVAHAAHRLAGVDQLLAIEVLSSVHFADAPTVAAEVLGVLDEHGPLRWEDLTEVQQDHMWDQLVECPSIEHHHITSALSEISRSQPERVVRLLMDRATHQDGASHQRRSMGEYRAIPFGWAAPLHVQEHHEYPSMLRQVRDWMLEGLDSWTRRDTGAEAFWLVAGGVDDHVLSVLDEFLAIGTAEAVETVGAILREGPSSVVWEHVRFVVRLLNVAAGVSEECLRVVSGSLLNATQSEVRTGVVGQPFQEDLHQQSTASTIAETLAPRSVEADFYQSLARSAEESIRWNGQQDEMLLDRRSW